MPNVKPLWLWTCSVITPVAETTNAPVNTALKLRRPGVTPAPMPLLSAGRIPVKAPVMLVVTSIMGRLFWSYGAGVGMPGMIPLMGLKLIVGTDKVKETGSPGRALKMAWVVPFQASGG